MDEALAEQLGRKAFRDGNGNSPLFEPELYAELQDAKVGEKTHLMRAFNTGWTAENLAADPESSRG